MWALTCTFDEATRLRVAAAQYLMRARGIELVHQLAGRAPMSCTWRRGLKTQSRAQYQLNNTATAGKLPRTAIMWRKGFR
mmetsp:Transcript_23560/g.66963  ORF Transcript_23560/g.66963 Transcript_23560/m.66963 type:complete len:80 (+) Transcript_23560:105-344(+)